MSRVMIVTVGGSPDPLIQSIREHLPEKVYFIASHESVPQIGRVIAGLERRPEHQTVMVEDPEDLLNVYRKCVEGVKRIRGKEVLIDYTGGTKSMSAGVVLYGVVHGCGFAYVGGRKRNKEGLGVVETGSERIVPQENPFEFFAIREKERGVYLFNHYQFEWAVREFGSALEKVQDPREKRLITTMKEVAEAYHAWDLFEKDYDGVLVGKKLADAKRTLEILSDIRGKEYSERVEALENNIAFFEAKTRRGSNVERIADTFLNAERRGEEGKYDDGVARLYRCIEMVSQYRLKCVFDIDTSDVDIEKLPEGLRLKYERLRGRNEKIKIGLATGYELLKDLGDDVGRWYLDSEDGKRLQNLLTSRNNSILAHGVTPVGKRVFNDLLTQTRTFLREAFPEIDTPLQQGRFVKF
jgi:CRISPR-associated protein (TIGR02710 family)